VSRTPARARRATALRAAVTAATAVVLPALLPGGASAAAPRTDPVLAWYDETAAAVAAQGAVPQVVGSRTWALAWSAAERATRRTSGPTEQAALATAVHDVLVALVPAQAARVDAARDAALGTLPRGAARRGTAAGAAAARAVLAERQGDGLTPAEVNAPYTPPPPAVGVWRPTPDAFAPAVQSGQGRARPFLLRSTGQLRPPAPTGPGTERYRRDLAEVRALGQDSSTSRTPQQTEVARFWAQSSLAGFTSVVREVLAGDRGARASVDEETRLLSVFHRVTIDAQLAVYEAKYVYTAWRPVTAIREDGDGDAATLQVPDWSPLIPTPSHPEYPSGHTTYAGAAVRVLDALAGPRPARPVQATSAALPGVTLTYTRWQQLVQDNEDARVWSGIHLRSSDEVGSALGRSVAAYDLGVLGLRRVGASPG
jgi:hypothetical protein